MAKERLVDIDRRLDPGVDPIPVPPTRATSSSPEEALNSKLINVGQYRYEKLRKMIITHLLVKEVMPDTELAQWIIETIPNKGHAWFLCNKVFNGNFAGKTLSEIYKYFEKALDDPSSSTALAVLDAHYTEDVLNTVVPIAIGVMQVKLLNSFIKNYINLSQTNKDNLGADYPGASCPVAETELFTFIEAMATQNRELTDSLEGRQRAQDLLKDISFQQINLLKQNLSAAARVSQVQRLRTAHNALPSDIQLKAENLSSVVSSEEVKLWEQIINPATDTRVTFASTPFSPDVMNDRDFNQFIAQADMRLECLKLIKHCREVDKYDRKNLSLTNHRDALNGITGQLTKIWAAISSEPDLLSTQAKLKEVEAELAGIHAKQTEDHFEEMFFLQTLPERLLQLHHDPKTVTTDNLIAQINILFRFNGIEFDLAKFAFEKTAERFGGKDSTPLELITIKESKVNKDAHPDREIQVSVAFHTALLLKATAHARNILRALETQPGPAYLRTFTELAEKDSELRQAVNEIEQLLQQRGLYKKVIIQDKHSIAENMEAFHHADSDVYFVNDPDSIVEAVYYHSPELRKIPLIDPDEDEAADPSNPRTIIVKGRPINMTSCITLKDALIKIAEDYHDFPAARPTSTEQINVIAELLQIAFEAVKGRRAKQGSASAMKPYTDQMHEIYDRVNELHTANGMPAGVCGRILGKLRGDLEQAVIITRQSRPISQSQRVREDDVERAYKRAKVEIGTASSGLRI